MFLSAHDVPVSLIVTRARFSNNVACSQNALPSLQSMSGGTSNSPASAEATICRAGALFVSVLGTLSADLVIDLSDFSNNSALACTYSSCFL